MTPAPLSPSKAQKPTPPDAAQFVEGDLGYLLGQAHQALYQSFERDVGAAGLTLLEWRVLATLHGGDAVPVSVLAREVLAKQPTVTKLLQRMAAQGWLALEADPADQRRTLAAITQTGRTKVAPLLALAQAQEQHALQSLSPIEAQLLKTLLARFAGTSR